MKESSWCALLSKMKLSRLLERRREKLLLLLIALFITIIIHYHHHGVLISGQQKVLFFQQGDEKSIFGLLLPISRYPHHVCPYYGFSKKWPYRLAHWQRQASTKGESCSSTERVLCKYGTSQTQIQQVEYTNTAHHEHDIECGTSQIQVSI